MKKKMRNVVTQVTAYIAKYRFPVATVVLALSLILPYLFLPFGVDFTDTPYHLVKSHHYLSYPMTVLSYHLIGKWQEWTGGPILLNRFAVLFFMQLSGFLLIRLPLRQNCKLTRYLALITLNVLLSLFPVTTLLGYDTVSTVLIVGTFCALYSYEKRGFSVGYLILSALFSVLAVFSRLPNLVMLPAVVLWLAILAYSRCMERKRALISLALFITSFVCLSLLVFYYYYSSFGFVLRNYRNEPGGHGFYTLLQNYFIGVLKCISWIGVLTLVYMGFSEMNKYKKANYIIYLSGSCVFAGILFLLLVTENKPYNFELTYLLIGLFAILILSAAYPVLRSGVLVTRENGFFFLIGLFFLIPIAGSQSGLFKANVIFFIPFLIRLFWTRFSQPVKCTFLSVMMAVLLYLPVQRMRFQYEDRGILRTQAKVEHPALWGIRTTAARKVYLESVMSDLKALRGPYIFVGRMRHMFDFLSRQDGVYSEKFWSYLDDDDYVADTQRHLSEKRIQTVFLVPDYPDYPEQIKFGENKLEAMLIRQGYVLSKDAATYRSYQRSQ